MLASELLAPTQLSDAEIAKLGGHYGGPRTALNAPQGSFVDIPQPSNYRRSATATIVDMSSPRSIRSQGIGATDQSERIARRGPQVRRALLSSDVHHSRCIVPTLRRQGAGNKRLVFFSRRKRLLHCPVWDTQIL